MTFIDFFSGIGGFRLGMEMVGHECLGHCEIDKYADKSYRAMHNVKEGEWYADDVRRVSSNELPQADCWCGGFPCQSFSIAGKRRGFEDMRGTLVFEIFRLASERKPSIIFLENVAGLLNHDGGRTFATILCGLWELGYDVEWELLNSKNFGVPQNRERVFIIGHLRGQCGRKVFPIGYGSKQNVELRPGVSQQIASTLCAGDYKISRGMNLVAEPTQEVKCLNSKDENGKQPPQQARVYDTSGVMTALQAEQAGRFNIAVPVLTPNRPEKRQNGRRFKENGEDMFTLTAQDRHGVAILAPKRTDYGKQIRKAYENGEISESRHNMTELQPREDGIANTLSTVQKDNLLMVTEPSGMYVQTSDNFRRPPLKGISRCLKANMHDAGVIDTQCRIRRLTPLECFRLQGFPDELFYKAQSVNSDSQLYKQAGNSVTVNVIYEIAQRLEDKND